MASKQHGHHVVTLCTWLFLLCCTTRAAAAPSPAERDTARALMDDGDRLRASGELRGAMQRYRAAHAIMHVPSTGLDLAQMEAQLGMLVEARASAMEVVNLPLGQAEPAVFQEARVAAAALVKELEPRVPSLQTLVTPKDSAYRVTIDGVTLPDEARSVAFRTNPGLHSVQVEAPGYAAMRRDVVLTEGQTLTVDVALSHLEPAQVAALHTARSTAPSSALRTDRTDDARAAGQLRGFVGLGVGAVALATGAVTGIMSLSKTKQEQRACQDNHCDVSRADALSTANTLANIANVGIALGVVGALYGSYELLTLPAASPTATARARVELGIAGIRIRGTL